jgi:hypothetical protein
MKEVMDDLWEKYPNANEAQLKEMAALSTREAKYERNMDEMRKEWGERLEKIGYDRESLRESLPSKESEEPGRSAGRSAEDYVRLAADIIYEGESTFGREKLQEMATRLSVGEHRVSDIETAAMILEKKGEIVPLGFKGNENGKTERASKTPERDSKTPERGSEKSRGGDGISRDGIEVVRLQALKNCDPKTPERDPKIPERGNEKSGGGTLQDRLKERGKKTPEQAPKTPGQDSKTSERGSEKGGGGDGKSREERGR